MSWPGPDPAQRSRAPYLPPKPIPPRLTLKHDLPDGCRRGADRFGFRFHEYLQHDGEWRACAGRRTCRECIKEDTMKSTMKRLREAVTEHFGFAHLMHIDDETDLFQNAPSDGLRRLGDGTDRAELADCIGKEFGVFIPDESVASVVTLKDMAALVDVLVASRDADDH